MKIHYTATFLNDRLKYHGEVEMKKVYPNSFINDAFKIAVAHCKTKCNEVFKKDFETMTSFEVYHYDHDGKELRIFHKAKF